MKQVKYFLRGQSRDTANKIFEIVRDDAWTHVYSKTPTNGNLVQPLFREVTRRISEASKMVHPKK